MSICIAIDGPAGAGKSTIAKRIAKQMQLIYVDTGAMYRAMAYYLLQLGLDLTNSELVSKACLEPEIEIEYRDGEQVVLLNGENVNSFLRKEEVGVAASLTSGNPRLRARLVELQQKMASKTDLIMDGRDIGTCVLPNANLKIFLTADARKRAIRRYDELSAQGITCDLDSIEADIRERDHRDMTREHSPLKQAEDAILVDTTEMSIEEVVNRVIELSKSAEVEIRMAKSAGFCFGVQRAVEQVYEQVGKVEKLYTYGPIIHNKEVVKDLERKGAKVIDEDGLRGLDEGTVIIRSHGVSKAIYDCIEEKGLSLIDATCPFVRRIHDIVEVESTKGKHIVIIGNKDHPEVQGIVGWCFGKTSVVETEEEAEELISDNLTNFYVVSQTTFNYIKFQKIVAIFQRKEYNSSIVNTICNATEDRQTEARDIARDVDVMIVIGDKQSSNSKKLYEICKSECRKTYFVQTVAELKIEQLPENVKIVGITAGASTPINIIEEVRDYVRIIF